MVLRGLKTNIHYPYLLFQDKSRSDLFILDNWMDIYGVLPTFSNKIKRKKKLETRSAKLDSNGGI